MPLAPILAVLAATLTFIPNIGPVLATPFSAVLLRVGQKFYVEDYLDKEPGTVTLAP